MRRRSKMAAGAAAALALAAGAVGVAAATGGDDGDNGRRITGTALDRASSVAVEHVGEGRVTGTEVGDEESWYEVEVTRPDGTQVDVQLDRAFHVVGDEADGESERDGED